MPFVGLMTPRASPQMEVTRPRRGVPGRKTPFYADVTTRLDTLDHTSFSCDSKDPQRGEMTVLGRIQEMLRPTFARALFRWLSAAVPFGSHFPLLRGCFWPTFPLSLGDES